VARFARYLRAEKYITASDTGGIIERWKYGRRLLVDGKATTLKGNLKHGVLDTLIGNATASGYKLAEREIQWRLKCARTYPTEAQIRNAITDFETWFALTQASFPAVEAPEGAEPYDPRDADERDRDTDDAGRRLARAAAEGRQAAFDEIYSDYWPRDTYGPLSSLEDLAKHHEDMCAITDRFARRDEERGQRLRELLNAVDGDTAATWDAAERARLGLPPADTDE
jgi:hypothetical protein